jgi:hypothetical protein
MCLLSGAKDRVSMCQNCILQTVGNMYLVDKKGGSVTCIFFCVCACVRARLYNFKRCQQTCDIYIYLKICHWMYFGLSYYQVL